VVLNDGDVGAFWVRAPAGALDNTFTPPVLAEPDNTLIRLRAIVGFSSNNGGAQLNQSHNIAFGIIAWDGLTDDPTDVGLLPHPAIDLSLDWIWRVAQPEPVDNIALSQNGSTLDSYESKAQRKLSNGTGLLFTYGFVSPAGGAPASLTIVVGLDCRYLVKLP